ncbi:MAG: glucose-1-phosphate thymidylyltransferase [Porphyromonadaceae bacterium]|nr:glucose-1-phosphate thymidylyltransferase [Porphyromonadaceae bacterium]
MKNRVLFDTPEVHCACLPITFTRAISDIRVGILTIKEKWQRYLPGDYATLTAGYLAVKYPVLPDEALFVAGNVCPDANLAGAMDRLLPGEALVDPEGVWLAFCGTRADFDAHRISNKVVYGEKVVRIQAVYDIFRENGQELEKDFRILTAGRLSQPLPDSCQLVGTPVFPDGTPKLFIEEGAKLQCVTLNLNNGPIYIGQDAEIMEGVCIRAPFAACSHVTVNMNAKIYGATTLGPHCKAGGELSNVVMLGYSNKGHDGYLGNAVIGEWCNLGADTNCSNLKNNYAEVKLWDYASHRFRPTGLQFCGLLMGDHSRSGINTMFNTATVVGVGANVYGPGFPRTVIESFVQGGSEGFKKVPVSQVLEMANRMMARRGKVLTTPEIQILHYLSENPYTY